MKHFAVLLLFTVFSSSVIIYITLISHNMSYSMFFSIKKHDTYDAPIKAKEELVFHVGFRQFVAR
jgi:pre-rRNA-processing protein TSR1